MNEAAAASAALLGVARSLASTCIGTGVTVNTLAVGFVDDSADLQLLEALGTRQERLLQRDEVSAALLFLLSDASSALNGAVLPVDLTLSGRL
jgi:NAD(P)-dependent dehydrogenase (short-subunit alcohol dehydrogenase family)